MKQEPQYIIAEAQSTDPLAFWRQYLANVPALLELPLDRPPRKGIQPSQRGALEFPIANELFARLRQYSQTEAVPLFVVLLAGFQALLSRYSGQEDFLLGLLVTGGRTNERVAAAGASPFNPLLFRSHLEGKPAFQRLVRDTYTQCRVLAAQRDVAVANLAELVQPGSAGGSALPCQTLFTCAGLPGTDAALCELFLPDGAGGIEGTGVDLALSFTESPQECVGRLEYNSQLFDASTIVRLQGHLLTLLQGAMQSPEQGMADLPLLTVSEEQYLVQELSSSFTLETSPFCFHELFEAQVERTPEAVAALFEDQAVTYQQLNARANRLARHLQELGVGKDLLVGLCVERSLEMLVALLAVFKAGGAYLPLDPTYPVERLNFMLEDAQAPVLITQRQFQALWPAYSGRMVYLDDEHDLLAIQPATPLALPADIEQLAYTIYTSGSTGNPKGVQITQKALVNFLRSMVQEPGLSSQDRLLAVTTLSFDIAGLELYLPLLVGACVVIASRELANNGPALADLMERERITIMQATPMTWRILLASGWSGSFSLSILCGGEAMSRDLADQLLPRVRALYNMYGPTETTIWSTLLKIEPALEHISIGRPIASTTAYVLDRHLLPVPLGVVGELLLGGAGLARGYWRRPELTAERFVHCTLPGHAQASRLYRTGDLARYRGDGRLELIGRVDNQVKIRGYRIELGEIESVLARHPAVQQAVTIVREDEPGDQRLVAYLVAHAGQTITSAELRQLARASLPAYMVPIFFLILQAFPQTPNGKVDRRALPVPEQHLSALAQAEREGPRTPLEEALAQIWTQVLKHSQFGIYDDFFDLGGHSLLATQVLVRLRRLFRMELEVQDVFSATTIAQLATLLVNTEPTPGHVTTIARLHKQISSLSTEEVRARLAGKKAPVSK